MIAAIWQLRTNFENTFPCGTKYLVTEFIRTRIKSYDFCLFSLTLLLSQGVYLYFFAKQPKGNIKRSFLVGLAGLAVSEFNGWRERAKRKWVIGSVLNPSACSEMFSPLISELLPFYLFTPKLHLRLQVGLSLILKAPNFSFKFRHFKL